MENSTSHRVLESSGKKKHQIMRSAAVADMYRRTIDQRAGTPGERIEAVLVRPDMHGIMCGEATELPERRGNKIILSELGHGVQYRIAGNPPTRQDMGR